MRPAPVEQQNAQPSLTETITLEQRLAQQVPFLEDFKQLQTLSGQRKLLESFLFLPHSVYCSRSSSRCVFSAAPFLWWGGFVITGHTSRRRGKVLQKTIEMRVIKFNNYSDHNTTPNVKSPFGAIFFLHLFFSHKNCSRTQNSNKVENEGCVRVQPGILPPFLPNMGLLLCYFHLFFYPVCRLIPSLWLSLFSALPIPSNLYMLLLLPRLDPIYQY